MTLLDKVCGALGHKLKDTLVIMESGDFYDIDYAKYCSRCGEVEPQSSLKKLENNA